MPADKNEPLSPTKTILGCALVLAAVPFALVMWNLGQGHSSTSAPASIPQTASSLSPAPSSAPSSPTSPSGTEHLKTPDDEQVKRADVAKALRPVVGSNLDGIVVIPPKTDEGWNVCVDLVSHLDRESDARRARSAVLLLLNARLDIRDVLASSIYKRAEPNDITTVYAIQGSRNGEKRDEGDVHLTVVSDGPYPSSQR